MAYGGLKRQAGNCDCCPEDPCTIYEDDFTTDPIPADFTYSGTYSHSAGVISSSSTTFRADCDTVNPSPYNVRVHSRLRGASGDKPTLYVASGTDELVIECVPGVDCGTVNVYQNTTLVYSAVFTALQEDTWVTVDVCVIKINSRPGYPSADWPNVTVTINGTVDVYGVLSGGESHGIDINASLPNLGNTSGFGSTGDFDDFGIYRVCEICNDDECWFEPDLTNRNRFDCEWEEFSGTWDYDQLTDEMYTNSSGSTVLSRAEHGISEQTNGDAHWLRCVFKFAAYGQKFRFIIAADDENNYACLEIELGASCSTFKLFDVVAGVDDQLYDESEITGLSTATWYSVQIWLVGDDQLWAQFWDGENTSLTPRVQLECDDADAFAHGTRVGFQCVNSVSGFRIKSVAPCFSNIVKQPWCQLIDHRSAAHGCWEAISGNISSTTAADIDLDGALLTDVIARNRIAIPSESQYAHMVEAKFSQTNDSFYLFGLLLACDQAMNNGIYCECQVGEQGGVLTLDSIAIGELSGGLFQPYDEDLWIGVGGENAYFPVNWWLRAYIVDGVVTFLVTTDNPTYGGTYPGDWISIDYDYLSATKGSGPYTGVYAQGMGAPKWSVTDFNAMRCGAQWEQTCDCDANTITAT